MREKKIKEKKQITKNTIIIEFKIQLIFQLNQNMYT